MARANHLILLKLSSRSKVAPDTATENDNHPDGGAPALPSSRHDPAALCHSGRGDRCRKEVPRLACEVMIAPCQQRLAQEYADELRMEP